MIILGQFFLPSNIICCGNSLELPKQGAAYDCPSNQILLLKPLKRQAKFVADDILKILSSIFQRKQVLTLHVNRLAKQTIVCESSAKQTIHMQCQDLRKIKKKKKIVVCCSCDWRFKS